MVKRVKMFDPPKKTHMHQPGHGTELYTPGGDIKVRQGPIYGPGRFVESFRLLRKVSVF